MLDDNQTIEIVKDIAVLKEQGRTMSAEVAAMRLDIGTLLKDQNQRIGLARITHSATLVIGTAIGWAAQYFHRGP